MSKPKREEVEWVPTQPKARFDGAEERREQPAPRDDLQRLAARPAQPRRRAGEPDLADGYRIAEDRVAGTSPTYRVLRAEARDERLVGIRDNREEAVGLAHMDHNRIQAARADTAARHIPAPPAPRR